MQREIKFETLEGFIRSLKENGIEKIAFGEVNERRAKQVERELLKVLHVKRAELIAYKNATLYKCVMEDVDLDEVSMILADAGFDVTRRNRNIL